LKKKVRLLLREKEANPLEEEPRVHFRKKWFFPKKKKSSLSVEKEHGLSFRPCR